MRTISRAAVHEAGHVIACAAMAVPIFRVYIGVTWFSNSSNLIDMVKGRASDGRVLRGLGTLEQESVICVSGFMSESLWTGSDDWKDGVEGYPRSRFLEEFIYASSDALKLEHDMDLTMDISKQLLLKNRPVVIKLARHLNTYPCTSFWKEDMATLLPVGHVVPFNLNTNALGKVNFTAKGTR